MKTIKKNAMIEKNPSRNDTFYVNGEYACISISKWEKQYPEFFLNYAFHIEIYRI